MSKPAYLTLALLAVPGLFAVERPTVDVVPVPNGGIQPQVTVGGDGVVHLVYFQGEASHGDIFYVRSQNEGRTWSSPIRVNSGPQSAVATGTIRGAQLAVAAGRVHVVWNGSSKALPRGPLNPEMPADSPHNGSPLLYARSDAAGGFEKQRNLISRTYALDGGGAVAAGPDGRVYVSWHASSEGSPKGEAGRRIWIARSSDGGHSFAPEEPAFDRPTGACACCGMALETDSAGNLYALYRSAADVVHRDVYLLLSKDHGATFQGKRLHEWEIGACPMSSMVFEEGPSGLLTAWETAGQVYFSSIAGGALETSKPTAAPGKPAQRKHPRIAVNDDGQSLLVWTDVPGWGEQGTVSWRVFDARGKVLPIEGRDAGAPAWSFAAAFTRSDGSFVIVR